MYNKNIRKENCYFIRETTIASLLFHREKREEETKQILSKRRKKARAPWKTYSHRVRVFLCSLVIRVDERKEREEKSREREKGLTFLETIFKYFRILFRGSIWKSA